MPARADVAAGQAPLLGRDHVHAAGREHGEVGLHGRVLPHLGVHGGAHDHRGGGGHQRGGQQVVGQAGGVAGQQVGGCSPRRHHHQPSHARPSRVWGMGATPRPAQTGLGRFGSEARRQVASPDEPGRTLGQHRCHVDSGVDQATADLDRLVGGDAGGHTEHHERMVSCVTVQLLPPMARSRLCHGHSPQRRSRPGTGRGADVICYGGLGSSRRRWPFCAHGGLDGQLRPSARRPGRLAPSSRARAAASARASSSGSGRE